MGAEIIGGYSYEVFSRRPSEQWSRELTKTDERTQNVCGEKTEKTKRTQN